MIQIRLLSGEIEISTDEKTDDVDELLNELSRVLCFTIVIYKRRLEKKQQNKLTKIDEKILNQKIKDSIAMIPVDEVRELIKESGD